MNRKKVNTTQDEQSKNLQPPHQLAQAQAQAQLVDLVLADPDLRPLPAACQQDPQLEALLAGCSLWRSSAYHPGRRAAPAKISAQNEA